MHMDAQRLLLTYRLACMSGGDAYARTRGVFSRWCSWKYKRVPESARMGFALSARAAFVAFHESIQYNRGRIACDEASANRHIDCLVKYATR